MSKFTAGPWMITKVCDLPDGGKWIDVSDGAYELPLVSVRHKDHEANAALIAAAPDMYEALRNMLASAIPGMNWTDEIGQVILEQASAALMKAEGKS